MNKCCLVNYKTHFTVYIFRVTNTDNIPYELYRNSESWFNPKLKTIPFFFEMEVTVRTLEACTKQQNRHTALPAFHPAPVPRDQTKRIQFDQGTVAWHCMIPIPAVSSDRAVPRKSREREKRTQWLRLWLAASTSMVHGHGHPCAKSTPTAAGRTQQHHGRAAGTVIPATSRHTSSPFFSQHTASRSIPVQRFSSVTLRMCCVVWPCPPKWHPVPGNAAHVAAAAANLLRLLNRKQSG